MNIPDKYKIRNVIWIEADMFYSEAYQSIRKSASTINTLMRCLQKRKFEYDKVKRKTKIVYTNEPFIFPYREAKIVLGIGTTSHWKNLRKLIEVGFLDLDYQGGWYQRHEKEKDYSRYKFSERWRMFGKPNFVKVKIPKALPDGFHIVANMERKKLKSTSLKRSCHLHSTEDVAVKSGNYRLHSNEVVETAVKSRQSHAVVI